MLTEVPSPAEEGWVFRGSSPVICSPQMLPAGGSVLMIGMFTRDRFAKAEGGLAGPRRGLSLMVP